MALVAVYADGGVIKTNPSMIGGTYAWCHVDDIGLHVREAGGVLKYGDVLDTSSGTPLKITNNHSEFYALLLCLEQLRKGWSGQVVSDSEVTLGRFFWGWTRSGIPNDWCQRADAVVARLSKLTPIHVAGHPSKSELRLNRSKKGKPVSIHNVWCDRRCKEAGLSYLRNINAEHPPLHS